MAISTVTTTTAPTLTLQSSIPNRTSSISTKTFAFSSSNSSFFTNTFKPLTLATHGNRSSQLKNKKISFSCNCLFGLGVPELAVFAGVVALVFIRFGGFDCVTNIDPLQIFGLSFHNGGLLRLRNQDLLLELGVSISVLCLQVSPEEDAGMARILGRWVTSGRWTEMATGTGGMKNMSRCRPCLIV